jgi:hypothetical protein
VRADRQVHVWMTSQDYAYLEHMAAKRGESVSGLLRRLVRTWRQRDLDGTSLVPSARLEAPVGISSARGFSRVKITPRTGK